MKYALFLGCIVPNRYPGIEAATRKTFDRLGITLIDMHGASCCPAPGVVGSLNAYTWLAIGARNLALAESLGLDILTVCNGCFETLFEVNKILKEDSKLREKINGMIADVGYEFKASINVCHFVKVLSDLGTDKIRERIKNPLSKLNVAVHYGCHLLYPSKDKQIDHPFHPKILDRLIETLGAKSIDYENKLQCCGAGGGVRSGLLEFSLSFTREKLKAMKSVNVNCIVDVCPFCHLQFDRGQDEIKKFFGEEFKIPVIHYSQFLGLAMGLDPKKVGLYAQHVPCDSLIAKIK